MAALNFPNSPSLNDTHTENGVTFKWNGAAWDRLGDIGAQGAAGAQGAVGAQGLTGPVVGSSSQVVYKDGSNNPAGSSSFTFDGTNLTVGGNVSIGGTLTYEDVTNIDSVGLITARAGVKVPDSQRIFVGTDDDLEIYHDGNTRVRHTGVGDLLLQSNSDVYIQRASDGHQMIIAENDGPVKLYYDNSEKFKTTSGGVEVSSGNLTMPSNGRIYVGNGGNATNPMFANVSDTNTGIAFPAADTMMFTTGGSERLRIDSSGAVRINTAGSPSADLHVGGTSGVLNAYFQTSSATGAYHKYSLGDNSADLGYIGSARQISSSGQSTGFAIRSQNDLEFCTGGSTEKLRITSAGQMGLGTNDPNSYGSSVKLAVANTSGTCGLSIISASNGDGNLYYADGTSGDATYRGYIRYNHTTDQFRIGVAGAERLRIASDGKIGINDTSPASLLTVNNGTNDDHCFLIKNDNVGAYFGTYGTGHGSYPREVTINGTRIDSGSAPYLRIGGQGGIKFCVDLNTERLRIDSNGNIGINETSPYYKLHLKTNNNATSLSGGTSGNWGSDGIRIENTNATGGSMVLAHFRNYDADWHIGAKYVGANDSDFIFLGEGSEKLRITSDGKLGINVTSPGCQTGGIHAVHDATEGTPSFTGGEVGIFQRNYNSAQGCEIGIIAGSNSSSRINFGDKDDADVGIIQYAHSDNSMRLHVGASEKLRITSGGQVNIGGNYTQTSYRLQVDGSVKGDYFTGESLSNRTGYKWGASGIYYLTLGGSRNGNASSFTMFELTGMNNSKFVEIQISFAHAGGGSHGSYRRAVYTSNGYQGLNTLENVQVNYGGGSGFTINKPNNNIVRVVWNGCTSFQDGFALCCEVKTSNSGTVFQNVDSAFS